MTKYYCDCCGNEIVDTYFNLFTITVEEPELRVKPLSERKQYPLGEYHFCSDCARELNHKMNEDKRRD